MAAPVGTFGARVELIVAVQRNEIKQFLASNSS